MVSDIFLELEEIVHCSSEGSETPLDLIDRVIRINSFPELQLCYKNAKTVIRYITTGDSPPMIDYFYLMKPGNKIEGNSEVTEKIATDALRKLKEKHPKRKGLMIDSYDKREI